MNWTSNKPVTEVDMIMLLRASCSARSNSLPRNASSGEEVEAVGCSSSVLRSAAALVLALELLWLNLISRNWRLQINNG